MGIPPGSYGTRVTLALMSKLTRGSKKILSIRLLSLKLVNGKSQKDYWSEVKSIHKFVRDDIRYVRDVRGVETLHTPEKTLEFGQGDCDDKSTLLASLLESIGHRTRFVAVGFVPGKFSHVYVETKVGNRWIALETTEPWEAGRFPPGIVIRMVQHN